MVTVQMLDTGKGKISKFCYLGDMTDCTVHLEVAVTVRVRAVWKSSLITYPYCQRIFVKTVQGVV